MKINRSHIRAACLGAQQPTKSQFLALGYDGLFIGWRNDLLGKEFTPEQILAFTKRPRKKRGAPIRGQKKKKKKNQHKKKPYKPPQPPKPKEPKPDPYKSEEWDKKRKIIYARDNYTCQMCGRGVKDDVKINAHHLLYERDKDVWDVPNFYLITLCNGCHKGEHSKRLAPPRKLF